MALINCPECDGSVSTRAATCPHCGFPVPEAVEGESESNEYANEDSGTAHRPSKLSPTVLETLNQGRSLALFVGSGLATGLTFFVSEEGGLQPPINFMWFPGLYFGVALALILRLSGHVTAALIGVSGCISFSLGGFSQATEWLFDIESLRGWAVTTQLDDYISSMVVVVIGAMGLLIAVSYFVDRLARGYWRVAVAAALLAIAGRYLMGHAFTIFGSAPLGFLLEPLIIGGPAVWQATIGLLILNSLQKAPAREHERGSLDDRLHQFLLGPVVQIIGIVGTVASVIAFLSD